MRWGTQLVPHQSTAELTILFASSDVRPTVEASREALDPAALQAKISAIVFFLKREEAMHARNGGRIGSYIASLG
jgi:hypothetical protein